MTKPKNTKRVRVSLRDAISLHAEAFSSDPFAAKRIAMTLRNVKNGDGETQKVAEESKRLLTARDSRIDRRGVADWLSGPQIAALCDLRAKLATKKRAVKKHSAFGKRYVSVAA